MSTFNLNFSFDNNGTNLRSCPPKPITSYAPHKILFIDAYATEEEIESETAFASKNGNILSAIFTKIGLLSSSCAFAHVYNKDLPNNRYTPDWHSQEARSCSLELHKFVQKVDPNLVVLIGDDTCKGLNISKSATTWRGSVFVNKDIESPLFNRKCMIIESPLMVMKQYVRMPLLTMDLRRAIEVGKTKEYHPPLQNYAVDISAFDSIRRLEEMRFARKPVSMDIEGYVNNITCVSFSNTEHEAFIIDLLNVSQTEEILLLRAIDEFCRDTNVPKILQNSLYDSFVLAFTHGILIRNIVDDTMLSQWELFPELPKGLELQTSIWTDYPYYKSDRKIDDRLTHHRYCCTDSDVTLQCRNRQLPNLTGSSNEHYRFNMKMLEPLLYAQIKGMKYDKDLAKLRLEQTKAKLNEIQSRINSQTFDGRIVNVNSPKQLADFLYKEKGLPTQFKVEKGRKTNKATTDVKALLSLQRKFQLPLLSDLLLFRKIEKQRQSLEMTYDKDGRVRCSYNVVGTKTGRLSCSQSAHGTGTNLTTVPKQFRDQYVADDGFYFFQCDLAGADGWTVAAHAKALGDSTMLDDYYYGLKPAKIIALMYLHGREVNTWSRERLLEESKSIGDGWLYFSTKQVQHGSNYGLKANGMSQNIMLQSYKRNNEMILVTPQTCQELQDLYLIHRYPGVGQWQNRIKNYFMSCKGTPEMPSATGHTRKFFGRKHDNSTHQEAFSHEPQINTTYATNLAILNMWNDPENRVAESREDSESYYYKTVSGKVHQVPKDHTMVASGDLLIQPLHQVHDAACGQFPTSLEEWAKKKIRSYFNNELSIAGTSLVIPYDGEYGRSWGQMDKQL